MSKSGGIGVVVVPRARRSEIAGLHGGAVRIRIAAPPVDGAANAELVRFLAERLGVPRTAVRLVRGTASPRKTVTVDGLAPGEILTRLGVGPMSPRVP